MSTSMQSWLLSRRSMLLASIAGLIGVMKLPEQVLAASKAGESAWDLSETEWKKRLSPEAYQVLRQEGTERPFTSPFNKEKRVGT